MPTGRPEFPETRWSLVLNAKSTDRDSARDALSELASLYWYPLYAFARRSGSSPQDAEDLTQSFFARLLGQERVERIGDASHGRLRSYLLKAMKNHMLGRRRWNHAKKRGGEEAPLELDALSAEQRYAVEGGAEVETPETLYERRWALDVLGRAFTRLRAEYESVGKLDRYEALKETLGKEKSTACYQAAGQCLGISEGAARTAAHRFRLQFRALLRDEIADTVEQESEVEEEMLFLRSVLAKSA